MSSICFIILVGCCMIEVGSIDRLFVWVFRLFILSVLFGESWCEVM